MSQEEIDKLFSDSIKNIAEEDFDQIAQNLKKASDLGSKKAKQILGTMYLHGYGVHPMRNMAYTYLDQSAAPDSPQAMHDLALCLEDGIGCEADPKKAAKLYQINMEAGRIPDTIRLAQMTFEGKGVAKEEPRALELYEKVEEQGDLSCNLKMAHILVHGEGFGEALHVKRAIDLSQEASKAGIEGSHEYHDYLVSTYGVPVDFDDKSLKKCVMLVSNALALCATHLGCADGQFDSDEKVGAFDYFKQFELTDSEHYPSTLLKEVNTRLARAVNEFEKSLIKYVYLMDEQDGFEKAWKQLADECSQHFKKEDWTIFAKCVIRYGVWIAAESGGFLGLGSKISRAEMKALRTIGDILKLNKSDVDILTKSTAKNVQHDKTRKKMIENLQKSDKSKDLLGALYLDKDHFDPDKAFKTLSEAVEKGQYGARYNLGLCWLDGIGCEKNSREAALLFLQSAKDGNPFAMSKLGWCYFHGIGTDRNWVDALEWLEKSRPGGEDQALLWMSRILVEGRFQGVRPDTQRAIALAKEAVDLKVEEAEEYYHNLVDNYGLPTKLKDDQLKEAFESTVECLALAAYHIGMSDGNFDLEEKKQSSLALYHFAFNTEIKETTRLLKVIQEKIRNRRELFEYHLKEYHSNLKGIANVAENWKGLISKTQKYYKGPDMDALKFAILEMGALVGRTSLGDHGYRRINLQEIDALYKIGEQLSLNKERVDEIRNSHAIQLRFDEAKEVLGEVLKA